MARATDHPEETAEERRLRLKKARETHIASPMDLAWHVGAVDDSMPAILAAVRERYGRTIYIREVVAPVAERWVLRFVRLHGGWRVTGEMARPFAMPRINGSRMPAYTRLVIPMRPDGIIPRSLAPHARDLRRLIPGDWFGAGQYSKGLSVPHVNVTIDAPGWGVGVNVPSTPLAPALFTYPFSKLMFDRAVRRLRREAAAIKGESIQRRVNARGLQRWRAGLTGDARRQEKRRRRGARGEAGPASE